MTDTQPNATGTPSYVATIPMRFEVTTLPVADVDRTKAFYQGLGWRLDIDFEPAPGVRKIHGFEIPNFTITVLDVRDHDCDGIPDNDDNCDYTANPDQRKSDPNVAWGDACVPESGFRLTAFQSRSPVLMTCILTSRPP